MGQVYGAGHEVVAFSSRLLNISAKTLEFPTGFTVFMNRKRPELSFFEKVGKIPKNRTTTKVHGLKRNGINATAKKYGLEPDCWLTGNNNRVHGLWGLGRTFR
jgi:hypothetical protein